MCRSSLAQPRRSANWARYGGAYRQGRHGARADLRDADAQSCDADHGPRDARAPVVVFDDFARPPAEG